MRKTYNIKPGSTEWPEEAQQMLLKMIRRIFRSTPFNTCTTHKLPTMNVEEMTISIKSENARPTNVTTPYNIPVSFKNLAYEELRVAVRMGIMEPVPAGETSE